MKAKQTFLNKQLKNIMLERGLNQQSLADKLGVGQQLISFWITGRQKPSITSLKKLADTLDVPLSYFVEKNSSTINISEFTEIKRKVFLIEEQVRRFDAENTLLKKEIEFLKEKNKSLEKEIKQIKKK